ncbi:protein translocase subunit SecF [Shewanella fidelis]|uniref:Protein-export membrane protein SecF n=2 Tax=Shewanella fidelis TaxID=173509 RepID=A0AAW8NJF9_9GAMM|nr:protein translocase subunit SecF [Shewanella fidelis]MDR8522895.1 protein translocase subunit SecF [Shewanella fidelis]MDW4811779.1 protein translocase subunit SecF [Shewanella fidelis]MDW4815900.1 protein translocase subunit SecF [Shewanella fidelis]MDW4819990.1 protein translocase subunit SecF [Shewanella fidelis]MDW4824036.1 protein translocase subunit SecF [Shewanella fidelis]
MSSLGKLTKARYLSSVFSLLIMLASVAIIVTNGFNWGLDFTGGIVTEVKLDPSIKAAQISQVLGHDSKQEVSVISAGEPGRWVLRYAKVDSGASADIQSVLAPLTDNVEVLNSSIVGPQIGQELAEQGGLALLAAMLCILGYLSFRFEWRLASGALLALFHDVIFVLAFFSLTQMEFNLTILAAVLAILGYSLNDSIVIADRVREVLIAKPKMAIDEICSSAVKATFSRTMVTSGTTLFTVAALWIMGGTPLQGFSIAMFLGIMIGTISSISVGTCLPEYLKVSAEHYKVEPISDAP